MAIAGSAATTSVAIVKGTTKLESAQKLVDFLLSTETELRLSRSESRQIPLGLLDESQIPPQVRPLAVWAAKGADLRPLDLLEMGTLEYDITKYQPVLFCADGMGELEDVVGGFFAAFDDDTPARLRALAHAA